jgi:excisionase family DNA binding protein
LGKNTEKFFPAFSPNLRAIEGGTRDLLTVRDVAQRLSVSTATVYKLIERGVLPHVRVSNAIRVAPDDLARFLSAIETAWNGLTVLRGNY